MDVKLSDEDQALQRTCRAYAADRLLPEYGTWKDRPFPRERVQELGALGVLGIRVDPGYGGPGGSYVSLGIAAEELSRGDFNISYFLQLATINAELLQSGANRELIDEWLLPVASGDKVMAFGLTEPGVGSDAANLAATARRDGGDLVINGEKASITFAGIADACIVFARTGEPGARGISTILVPLDSPGVSRTVYSSVGSHLTRRGSLFFDDVRVPARSQIGEEGVGFLHAMTAFDFNRALIALACIGCAQQSIDETVAYAKTRHVFGKAMAQHEGVAFQVGEHLALVHAARLLAYEALVLADAGQHHTSSAAMAKWLGPKQAAEAIHACLILHGWAGYGTDLPFDQRLRDVMGLEIGDGTPEIMKAVIAREAFGPEYSAYK
ncbi:MAG: acyl-CoA dehydrogenase family protein [Acidimicrobiales bacterium]